MDTVADGEQYLKGGRVHGEEIPVHVQSVCNRCHQFKDHVVQGGEADMSAEWIVSEVSDLEDCCVNDYK